MVERNEVSWNAMISTFAHNGFSKGREVHGFCLRKGLECDVFVATALIDMYAKSERSAEASAVFHNMSSRNVVSWNTMVANFAQNRLELEAIGLVREMQSSGETPTSVTLTNVLPACARIGCLHSGKEIHARSIRNGSVTDLFVSNAITDMFAVLSACSHGELVDKGKKYFNDMLARNIEPSQMHYACMVDLLGRSGLMDEAINLITGLPFEPDSNVWAALLGA